MARTRAPDHDTRREQILELAAAKFAQTSYPSTSIADLATASGTSKARLYHYYASKKAILFDLLDRYTKRLMLIIAEVEGASQRRGLTEREAFAKLVRAFLTEYETSHSRHVALLNDVKYLEDTQREIVFERQRGIVAAFARQLARTYPKRATKENQTALTMMVFGMINWTFTWLKPDGKLGYRELSSTDRERLLSHFLALDEDDRLLRFGQIVPDRVIENYVANIDFSRDTVLAYSTSN